MERALISRYRELVEIACRDLRGAGYARAVQIASAARRIRGYGHIKARNASEIEREWERFTAPAATQPGAEQEKALGVSSPA